MNRASSATGWVRNPTIKSPDYFSDLASSYELGWTSNPITGCLNHILGLCMGGKFPCYAYGLANGRLNKRYLANKNVAPFPDFIRGRDCFTAPFWPRFWPSRVEDLLKGYYGKPKGIFICDMGELFGDWIPIKWQEAIFHVIRCRPQHRFYLLTKQPQNLAKFSPFPENCWVGVTATGYDAFNKALDYLKDIVANVKFISIEPLLEAIPFYMERLAYCGIGWLIIGAQTKPYRPPEKEPVQEIVSAADHAGIPVFLKDNLDPLLGQDPAYKKWQGQDSEGHELYGLRQEMPNG